ncbi:GSCOCG00012570001-RA-CDS, partial [Cotesia congregata]
IAEQNKSYKVSDIVNGVPKTYQTAAENILRYIEFVDGGKRLKWDDKGSVTLDDRKIPGANIVDLINDAVRHRKTVKATGRNFFASFLQEINTPREFVGNSSFWNKSLPSIKKLPIDNSTPKQYYDPSNPMSYSGARNLVEKFKKNIPEEKINDWLATQDAYTRHRPTRRKVPRLHYNVNNIDDVWEADLVKIKFLKTYDDGVSFILVVIDVLSKYVWVEPLLDKTARNPDVKAAVVERVNRTLKERMWRYFTHRKTYRYIDILQQLVEAYNHTKHSSIRMEPAAVTLSNAKEALMNIQKKFPKVKLRKKPFKYKVND